MIPNVEYTITEIAAPDGWILDSTVVKVTPVPFGTAQGTTNTATFTNHRGSVKFFKDYEGADPQVGASFTLTRDNDDADAQYNNGEVHVTDNGVNDQNNTMGVIKVDPLDAGSWKLIEDVGGAPTGWIRDGDEVLFTVPDAQGNRDVVLANPTLSDPRKTYDLTVVKVAEADNSKKIDGAVFNLYKESSGNSTLELADDTLVSSCTTGAVAGPEDEGQCTLANLAWGEKYYWYEVSVPAPYNLPSDRVIGPITVNADGSTSSAGSRTVTFQDPQSKIVTVATNGNLPNATISDTATLSGVNSSAAGAVTFDLYYTGLTTEPTPNSCTPAAKVNTSPIPALETVASVGNGDYHSGPISVDKAGYYAWIAHYSGDSNGNRAVDGACDDVNETSYVQPLQPGITTVAKAVEDDLTLPGVTLFDTAKVTPVTGNLDVTDDPAVPGVDAAHVNFYLYGPNDETCSKDAIYTSLNNIVTVVPDGQSFYAIAESGVKVVTAAGEYRWRAEFVGDANNASTPMSACDAPNEQVQVEKASPSVTTDIDDHAAGADSVLGAAGTEIADTATLSGATDNVTGNIEFKLYRSDISKVGNSTYCADATPVTTVTVPVVPGETTYHASYPVKEIGWYNWTAQYVPAGDPNNTASAVHGCGVAAETLHLTPRQPVIETQVPHASVLLGVDGTDLTDTATLSNGTTDPAISGSITFTLYGPFGPNEELSCTEGNEYQATPDNNPHSVSVDKGNGDYQSEAVHVSEAGVYTWVASYSGDDNNLAASHDCGLESETVTVRPRQPVIETQVSSTEVALSNGSASFSDSATISGGTSDIAGSISFRLFGPFTEKPTAESCNTGGVAVGSPVPVSGNAAYQGSTVSVSVKGWYTWMATFTSADGDNLGAVHACGMPSETVKVTNVSPTLEKVANPPSGSVVQPGETIVYTVTVGNTGDAAIDDGLVTDILPPYVTVDAASVTASGGTFIAGSDITTSAGTITWIVDLAPGATKALVYKVVVNQTAPQLATLLNKAKFFQFEKTTTHTVPSGKLTIVKEVSPVAGGGTVVEFGDKLTYTLTASATGTLDQPNVIVTDYLPGSDPARPKSGETTYVAGSAKCIGAGTCVVTGPDAKGLITWSLGSMAAGTSRQVTFQVTIDDVTAEAGETIAVDILNAGAVRSDRTPSTPSNEVVTPVTKVLPVKIPNKPPKTPETLPRTGTGFPVGTSVGGALALITLGMLMVAVSRRKRSYTPSA